MPAAFKQQAYVYVVENKNPHNLTITRILGCPMGFEPMTFRTTI